MFSQTFVASIAFLSVVSANPLDARAPNKKKPTPDKKCAEFDYDKLSLREVGQKNTLVSSDLPAKKS
jgi:inorganic pyrophosphatase